MLDASWYAAAAWLGSDQFDAAMVSTPCGCDLEARSAREVDAAAGRVLAREAQAAKLAWQCPYAGCEGAALGRAQEESLGAVERMTGWRGPATCPRAALSAPGIVDALRLLPAVEHGTLPTLTQLPSVLVEAAYACAQGRAARYEYEAKIREQDQQRKAGSGG